MKKMNGKNPVYFISGRYYPALNTEDKFEIRLRKNVHAFISYLIVFNPCRIKIKVKTPHFICEIRCF